MSPVASISGFADSAGDGNTSFSGLPLATQYTVLIDTTAGENETMGWNELDDIELEISYTY